MSNCVTTDTLAIFPHRACVPFHRKLNSLQNHSMEANEFLRRRSFNPNEKMFFFMKICCAQRWNCGTWVRTLSSRHAPNGLSRYGKTCIECCCAFSLFIYWRNIEFRWPSIDDRISQRPYSRRSVHVKENEKKTLAVRRRCWCRENFLFLFLINTLDEVLDTFNYSTRPMITTFIFAFSCRWVLAASAPYHRIGFCVFCWCRRSRICLCWYSWAMLWQRNRHSCTTQRRRRLCASPKLLHSPSRSEPTCAMCWCGTMVTTPPTTKPTKLLLNLSFRIDGARRHRNCLFAPNKWN